MILFPHADCSAQLEKKTIHIAGAIHNMQAYGPQSSWTLGTTRCCFYSFHLVPFSNYFKLSFLSWDLWPNFHSSMLIVLKLIGSKYHQAESLSGPTSLHTHLVCKNSSSHLRCLLRCSKSHWKCFSAYLLLTPRRSYSLLSSIFNHLYSSSSNTWKRVWVSFILGLLLSFSFSRHRPSQPNPGKEPRAGAGLNLSLPLRPLASGFCLHHSFEKNAFQRTASWLHNP